MPLSTDHTSMSNVNPEYSTAPVDRPPGHTSSERIEDMASNIGTLSEALDWAQRVARGRLAGGTPVFGGIENYINELEARVKKLEATLEGKTKALSLWIQETRRLQNERAALTSAPAGRMEYAWDVYANAYRATEAAKSMTSLHGWSSNGWQIRDDGTIAVMWQRPVASGQGSEESETVAKAIQMLQDGGCTDGGHHKQWYIDQTLRLLMGQEAYEKWRMPFQIEYGWDEGVAP